MLRLRAMRTVLLISLGCCALTSLAGCCSKKDESIPLPEPVVASPEEPKEEASAPEAPPQDPGTVETASPTGTPGAIVPKNVDGGAARDAASKDAATPAVPPFPSLPPGFPTTMPSSLPPMPTLIPSAFPFPQPAST